MPIRGKSHNERRQDILRAVAVLGRGTETGILLDDLMQNARIAWVTRAGAHVK
jgi:hypothetical protein